MVTVGQQYKVRLEFVKGKQVCRKPHDASVLWKFADLFAIVSNRGQNGAQGFDAHGDVQKMSGEEEVVVMSKQRH